MRRRAGTVCCKLSCEKIADVRAEFVVAPLVGALNEPDDAGEVEN